nr:hypothetical protein [Pandoravirus massiliensis]
MDTQGKILKKKKRKTRRPKRRTVAQENHPCCALGQSARSVQDIPISRVNNSNMREGPQRVTWRFFEQPVHWNLYNFQFAVSAMERDGHSRVDRRCRDPCNHPTRFFLLVWVVLTSGAALVPSPTKSAANSNRDKEEKSLLVDLDKRSSFIIAIIYHHHHDYDYTETFLLVLVSTRR